MGRDSIIKNFLFILFFGAGMFSVFLAILSDEIFKYYQLEINTQLTSESIEEIKLQDKQTEELIQDIEENPEIVKRLAPLKIGTEPNEPNALQVHLRQSELEQVQKALQKPKKQEDKITEIPAWVNRCTNPTVKKILFFAGAGLILLSFTCFRTQEKNN